MKKKCKFCSAEFETRKRKDYCDHDCKVNFYRTLSQDKTRDAWYKRRFLFSLREYNELETKQGGRCAICNKTDPGSNRKNVRRLCVDHDHKTSKVRGLLCSLCNRGLGQFFDDPELLRKAASYLERSQNV